VWTAYALVCHMVLNTCTPMEKSGFSSLLECQDAAVELRKNVRKNNPGEPWEILFTCGPTPDEAPDATPSTPKRPA